MDSPRNEEAIVFIIDDDPDVRSALGDLLLSVGLRSESFGSAMEFLQRNVQDVVSCLILDVRLPGPSGLDFQKNLTKADIGIPIIFVTGHGDIPMTVRAMKGGAVEFLTKPFREQDLLDAVQVALAKDRARREQQRSLRELRERFEALSPREQDVMALVTAGLMNKQVAAQMGISEVTVKVHRRNVMRKLAVKSAADLVRMADVLGLSREKT